MTEHESKITVKLSMSIDVFTESHPEDIDDATLRDIVMTHLYEQMQANMSRDALDTWFDEYEIDSVVMTEAKPEENPC